MVVSYGADDPDSERARDRWLDTANLLKTQGLKTE
jgi:hypothetical protein